MKFGIDGHHPFAGLGGTQNHICRVNRVARAFENDVGSLHHLGDGVGQVAGCDAVHGAQRAARQNFGNQEIRASFKQMNKARSNKACS
ncbi:hypothetical protein [Hydrogenophaga crassostreae]|uniref:hypothetical protein n=1 Tax=Hydrogenophaga crassostreae TaxID=1763535 RepID=UPI0018D4A0BF|nr:hypothetical protein [Hydrogenophaga crassostreae]